MMFDIFAAVVVFVTGISIGFVVIVVDDVFVRP